MEMDTKKEIQQDTVEKMDAEESVGITAAGDSGNTDELITKDGKQLISQGKSITQIAYHEKLNVIIVGTDEGEIFVLDPTLGEILFEKKYAKGVCFNVGPEKEVVVVENDKVGIRNDYNGIFLLDTILQTPVEDISENILLEMNKSEIEIIYNTLSTLETETDKDFKEVVTTLKDILNNSNNKDEIDSRLSVKKEKWSTIKINLKLSVLKSTFTFMVSELGKKNLYIPALSIASSLVERINLLTPKEKNDFDSPLEKNQMYSEANRLNTFSNWPHQDYRWALPSLMAQAGFYHNPSNNGDDRALCFTCNVCLVSWEPLDEPWSEHERHSPFCSFVRGEHTHNVPLNIPYSTCPAHVVKKSNGKPILGQSSLNNSSVIAYSGGNVVLFDTSRHPKETISFEVTLKDLVLSDPLANITYCDIDLKPKGSFLMDTSSDSAAPVNILSQAQDLIKVNPIKHVEITAVAVMGENIEKNNEGKYSLILIGGFINTLNNLNSAFLILYSVKTDVLKQEPSKVKPKSGNEAIKSSGKGTKSENPKHYDEDLLSYLADSEFTSEESIFLDELNKSSNEFLHSMKEKNAGIIKDLKDLKRTLSDDPSQLFSNKTKHNKPKVVIIEKLKIPESICKSSTSYNIRHIIPSMDNSEVVIIIDCDKNNEALCDDDIFVGAILIYKTKTLIKTGSLSLEKEPHIFKSFKKESQFNNSMPIKSCCLITPENGDDILLACCFNNGIIQIFNLKGLSLVHSISPSSIDSSNDYDKFSSVSYCAGLEKLCVGTTKGFLEMYSIKQDGSNDLLKPNTSSPILKSSNRLTTTNNDLLVYQPLSYKTMKKLHCLTAMTNISPSFTASVPSCWLKIIQAQKDRKHPLHLQNENEIGTLSWRLQANNHTRLEHLFELTLPKSSFVGYIDFKFVLQMGCLNLPKIEVSLYRSTISNNKKSKDSSNDVDSFINFGSQLRSKAPSNEFLKSINAELIEGPLLLENHLDLSASGGQVLLTSPLILLTKGKSFYLHIKAKIDKRDETTANNLQNISNKSSKVKVDSSSKSKQHSNQYPNPTLKSKLFKDDLFEIVNYSSYEYFNPSLDLLQEDPEKKIGCDVLHEVSISIKIPKSNSEIPNEHLERRKMLISKEFHEKLVKTVIFKGDEVSYSAQNAALDLLIWISSIILCGPNDSGYQINLIGLIEKYLNEIVLYGILSSDRQTSHKTTGLLISCIDTIETNYSRSESFITSVLKVLINLLKYSLTSYSPGCLYYFFLLFNRVRTENLNMANESLLSLLKVTSKELNKRNDENEMRILRTRFGLYGGPFESDLFEIELPKITKSSSHPLTYAGICSTSDPSAPPPTSVTTNTFRLWGLKDVDFRDLLVGNPLSIRLGKLGGLSPKQQIAGLLEVEPLHFSCHASSDGTRIEKIEFAQSTFTSVPIPQPWEPFTNILSGEGSKKTEPNKMDQIMMLQKALKMDNNESYYDISDLKFMEGGAMPLSNMYTLENPNWSKSGLVSSVFEDSVLMQMTAPEPGLHGISFEPGKVGFSFTNPLPLKQNSSTLTPKNVSQTYPQQKIASTSTSNQQANTTTTDSVSISNQSNTPSVDNESGIGSKNVEKDDLRLLLSPWQQLQQPPQQLLVIDRMHSGGRRFLVLDFGAPVILTDIVIPFCNDLVSLSIDIWLHREDQDGQRLVICSDIGMRSLVLSDLQPQPICRFLKITVIGRYGMNTTKCRIPIGMFFGHTTILQNIHDLPYSEATILTQQNIQAQCSVLSYLIEDIECRYQLACAKLKNLLATHTLYYLPRGGGRNKLGQCTTPSDQSILSTYQECMTLQQQLNVAKNIVKRLQRSLCSTPEYINVDDNPFEKISEICTDKIRSISEYVLDSLLGISYLATNNSIVQSINFDVTALFSSLNQETCETLFKEICILENGQTQLSLITLLLRISCYQKWWGNFISSTLKNLFSSFNTQVFPQDRVFLLLVYLGQKALLNGKNTSVLESSMELLNEILLVESDNEFLRASIDMNLVSWVVLFLCLCLDGVNCTLGMSSQDGHIINGNKKSKRSLEGKKDLCSRWNFIQGSVGKLSGPSKIVSQSGYKRRIQKKILAHKQKLEELDNVASGFSTLQQYSPNPLSQHFGGLSQLSALGSKIEAIKAKQYLGKTIKLQSSKQFKDLLHIRRGDLFGKRDFSIKEEEKEISNEEILNLNLDPNLCLKVAKSLGKLLLKMDSTCQSDIFLHCISILSRISCCSRPAISLGSIFDSEEIFALLLIAIGSDNNSSLKNNWSSPWVSHSIMCLFLDILEAEKIFPKQKTERELSPTTPTTEITTSIETESQLNNNNNSMSNDSQLLDTSEEMIIDDAVDSITVNEILKYGSNSTTPIEAISINESDESDIEEIISEGSNSPGLFTRFKKTPLLLKLSPCMTSISTALDARLENSIESTTELRLRMLTIIDSEVLSQSLKAPIELPVEILKNIGMENKDSMQIDESMTLPSSLNSNDLLSICFNRIFQMLSDSSVSIEKVLHLWLSFNFEASGLEVSSMIEARDFNFTPTISISNESVSSLMMVFTKNRTIGIQEWGLLFQCLTLAANQTTNSSGLWFHIINDKNFSEMILKFISGGINLHKNQMPSVGPTICKHFYTFLERLRQLAVNDSPKEIMNVCFKEILLRILDDFLSGPFLNADFPLDGMIKFLDGLNFPDLSFDPLTLISIFEKFAQILHIYVFFPNKLSLKTTDIKPLSNTQPTGNEVKSFVKTQTFENIMFRLVNFASSIISLPYKSKNAADKRVQEFFNRSQFARQDIQERENSLSQYLFKCGTNQPKTIADIIFQSENSMMRVLSVLANPNGMNVLTSGDLVTSINTDNPTTFVESVNFLFTKLCSSASNSKWTFLPILKFLSKSPFDEFYCPLSVSETFVLMVLKVINNEEYLKEFTKLNCIESICYKFVSCCRKQLCSSPSYISYLTQFIGKSDSNMMGQKRLGESLESDGLINVAPLGTISSTNLSAHPSEVLLATSAPHRRARSPAWSYHFNFQESFLELVINLPCAILLKEIQIIPHLTSISTSCPSAVQIEISKDRFMTSNPIGPAINCSSVSSINIQLKQPEVAQTIVIRLFKPKDSHTIGLSQIRILGCTTFSEASLQGFANQDNLKFLETSTHWMYILDRAFSVSKDNHILHNEILEKSIVIPNLLESCYSLLLSPHHNEKNQEIFLPRVTRCLYEFASFKKSISISVLMALLGPVQLGFSRANANQIVYKYQLNASVELVYQLCTSLPLWGHQNLNNLIKWMESAADMAINDDDDQGFASKKIVPDYIHAISCILWNITDVGKSDLSSVVNANLLKKLLQWTRKLDCKSELRACIDHVLCSICFNKPWLFIHLLYEMDIITPVERIEEKGKPVEDLLQNWYDENLIWERMHVKNLNEIELTEGCLMTIGRAAKSTVAAKLLHESEFLVNLNSLIMDYWDYYFKKWIKTTSTETDQNEEEMPMSPKKIISTQNLIGILSLYSELCNINEFKNWFGNQGSVFWSPILTLLSTISSNFKRLYFGHSIINLESAFISFFSSCCWTHPENQKVISTLLCEIILKQKSTPHKAVFLLHSMSSFCRRLLIQLLLENEKVTIHVKNLTKYPLKIPVRSIALKNRHPALLINGGDRVFQMSINSTFYELLKLIEPIGVTFEQNIKNNNSLTTTSDTFSVLKNQQGLIEQGLELIEQIQSNLAGKEKRMASTTMPPQQQVASSISITSSSSPFSTTQAAGGSSSSISNKIITSIAPEEVKRPYKLASKKLKPDTVGVPPTENNNSSKLEKEGPTLIIESEDYQNTRIPLNLTIAQIYSATRKPVDPFLDMLVFNFREDTQQQNQYSNSASSSSSTSRSNSGTNLDIERNTLERKLKELYPEVFNVLPIPATIEIFSKIGGLGLLAKHLPIVYPETLRQFSAPKYITNASTLMQDKESPTAENDWVKIENADDFYEEMMESIVASSTPLPKRNVTYSSGGSNLPPQYSMYAFGLFLTLPRFSEVLLGERLGAQCMLRLCLGVTDDADGNDIYGSAVAAKLPTLPFYVLRSLLDSLDLNSDEGKQIRQAMIDTYSLHFILACLSIFSHQNCDSSLVPSQHELVIAATKIQGGYNEKGTGKSDDKSHVYWAKGTGFGTGSTQQSWDVELALQKKKNEEENVTCLLLVLSSYIFPKILSRQFSDDSQQPQPSSLDRERLLPEEIISLVKKSCLFPAISGYLRNDSVLDMARHVPLYKAVLLFLRSLVSSPQLLPLLAPWEKSSSNDDQPLSILLSKMRDVVENYTRRLSNNKGKLKSKQTTVKTGEEIDDEGLALLINDIKSTAHHVESAIDYLTKRFGPSDIEMKDEILLCESRKTIDERYIDEMKAIQFGFYEMIVEEEATNGIRFTVPYHYESNVRSNWSRTFTNRLKRLAQESVTLSSSLPIAYGSTIFIRCDNDRLDVMKVLITGPSGTPYSNGCFEFDVFFPNDYPSSPMHINLETTGRQRVRFNPNLYTDGKVCLSILNTWHGRPEEKWNPQTSSLLPVLVAIQSLILNTEPYFNEPGYEKSRGTEQGERNSREYNAGIQIATLEWAMLDQLKNPSLCFKDIIQRHFWIKRAEIISQLDRWLADLIVTCKNDKRAGKNVSSDPVGVFKNNFNLLKKEFLNMKPPPGLEDLQVISELIKNEPENLGESLSSSSSSAAKVDPDVLDLSTTSELPNKTFDIINNTVSIISTPVKNQIEKQFEQAGINLEQVIIDTLDMENSGETSTASENDQMDI